ncbi:hypothetical protein C8R43DRAFT_963468 [Mycena crocata]|nr:hypothetical protein C8R43DRAFT_964484 [Mycena crocata]KAJ7105140.1 hypothetical protein C8R43DRAFT_1140930 [Mycena crocata]KAJ7106141.1 hypothetical protein C8R43DRAFT_963468 [Mycena crocata]
MQRLVSRREKARLRMARLEDSSGLVLTFKLIVSDRTRAELKSRPIEEQEQAAERSRLYQARYRERNRVELRIWEAQRRAEHYKRRFGEEAYNAYAKLKRERKRRAREKRRAKEGYYDERPQPAPELVHAPQHRDD